MEDSKNNEDREMMEAEDHVSERWEEGLCLQCGEHNDNKSRNLRICTKCEERGDDGSGEDQAISAEVDKRLGK